MNKLPRKKIEERERKRKMTAMRLTKVEARAINP